MWQSNVVRGSHRGSPTEIEKQTVPQGPAVQETRKLARGTASVLVVLLALWSLAGCGGSGNASREEPTAVETTDVRGGETGGAFEERDTAEGENPIRLTELGGAVWPVFSPDGRKIAFFNYPGGMEVRDGEVRPPQTQPELFVMDVDGGNPVRLAEQAFPMQLAFSPDGRRVAFASYSELNTVQETTFVEGALRVPDTEIYVVDADGSNPVNLTNHPAVDGRPTWSPDGRRIAFESNRDGNGDIYSVNPDGTGPINLTNSGGTVHDRMPTFSPDGTKIAFMSNREVPVGIYVMDADGSAPTRLTGNDVMGIEPRFSPDGRKLAFLSGLSAYAVNLDGTGLARIAGEGEEAIPVFPPVFLADGEKIAVKGKGPGGDDEIFAVNTDGTEPTNLTNDPNAHDLQPTFSPDGKKMAYVSQRYDESGRFVSEVYLRDLDRR